MDMYLAGTVPLTDDLGEFPVRKGEELTAPLPNSSGRGISSILFLLAMPPKSFARSFTDMEAILPQNSLVGRLDGCIMQYALL